MSTNTFDATALSLQHGQEHPYDRPDDGQPEPARDWAHKAARGILCDLTDRRGIKQGFREVDEDVRVEIVQSLAEIIRRATPPSPSTAEVTIMTWKERNPTLDDSTIPGDVLDELEDLRAALASRPAVEAGELPPLPTLPRDLLTMIGEYGMARTETVGQIEVQYRWEVLIGGIKQYASDYARAALATKPATSAPGAADGDRAALEVSFRAGTRQVRETLCGGPGTSTADADYSSEVK